MKTFDANIIQISKNYVAKSGRNSGFSLQHCRMMLMASGGAAPFDTDGLQNSIYKLIIYTIKRRARVYTRVNKFTELVAVAF